MAEKILFQGIALENIKYSDTNGDTEWCCEMLLTCGCKNKEREMRSWWFCLGGTFAARHGAGLEWSASQQAPCCSVGLN